MKTIKQQLSGGPIRNYSLILLMFLLVQCLGPEGPAGPRGFDGDDGADGYSMAYSAIYDIEPLEWDGDLNGYLVTIDVPEIDDLIYYEGAVLVYRLIETEPKSFNMLPYTYVDDGLTIYMDYDAYIGSIDLIYKEIFEGANDTFAPESLMSFKVVIIEGIPLATLKTMVDVSDYAAVVKLLNTDKVSGKEILF